MIDRSEQTVCRRKVRYETRREAKVKAARLRSSSSDRRAWRLTAYRCEHCGWWHIGHRPRADRLARIRDQLHGERSA